MAIIKPYYGFKTKGNLYYNPGARAWSVLKLKKDIINTFPKLTQRREKCGYKMVYSHDHAELLSKIQKIVDQRGNIPILLFFEDESS